MSYSDTNGRKLQNVVYMKKHDVIKKRRDGKSEAP
jgi:hypothetical protein